VAAEIGKKGRTTWQIFIFFPRFFFYNWQWLGKTEVGFQKTKSNLCH
jgi:hypothetical protein